MTRSQHIGILIGIVLVAVPLALMTPAQAADKIVSAKPAAPAAHKMKSHHVVKAAANKNAAVKAEAKTTKAPAGKSQVGIASWYGKDFDKHKTASGEKFSKDLPTAAHRHLPIGTHVKVTNLKNGQSTTVRVNDRGPYAKNRIIDLSQSAAKDIGLTHKGVAKVKIEVVGHDPQGATPAEKNAAVQNSAAAPETVEPSTLPSPAAATPVELADSSATASRGVDKPAAKTADHAAGSPVPPPVSPAWQRAGRRF